MIAHPFFHQIILEKKEVLYESYCNFSVIWLIPCLYFNKLFFCDFQELLVMAQVMSFPLRRTHIPMTAIANLLMIIKA